MISPALLYGAGIVVGLAGLWYTSDRVVSASLVIAKMFAVRTVVLGAIFMALVTGLPELLLSIMSVLNDAAQLSVGDIMGSNFIDTVVVIGFTAAVTGDITFGINKRRQLLTLLTLVTVGMYGLFVIDTITPLWGAGLIVTYALFMVVLWSRRRSPRRADSAEALEAEQETEKKHKQHIVLYGLTHLVMLAVATQVALYCGKELAALYDLPLELLGVTVFALATSLPEFVISIHAARRGAHGLLLGNALGAALQQGLFTLGILGLCARTPVSLAPVATLKYYFALGFAMLFAGIYYRRIPRWSGVVMVVLGMVFMVHEYCIALS